MARITRIYDLYPMDEFRHMRETLDRIVVLTEEEWQDFAGRLAQGRFRKGDYLVREGRVENHLYFLHRGATRHFFFRDGKEFTVDFQFEGEFVTAYYSFITREPSPISIELLADAEMVSVDYDSLQAFYRAHPRGERTGRLMAEYQYAKRLKKEMDLLSLTAEERYRELLRKNPDLVSQLSVRHLSSYLGIQPESLSRIRKSRN